MHMDNGNVMIGIGNKQIKKKNSLKIWLIEMIQLLILKHN